MTIAEIKGKFQFVIGLILFFPVVLDALGKASQMSEVASSEMVLKSMSIIAAILTAYLIFEILGEKTWSWLVKTLNYLLMTQMALFVITFYLLASMAGKPDESLSWWDVWIYKVDLFSLLLVPIVIAGLFALNLVWRIGEKIK